MIQRADMFSPKFTSGGPQRFGRVHLAFDGPGTILLFNRAQFRSNIGKWPHDRVAAYPLFHRVGPFA